MAQWAFHAHDLSTVAPLGTVDMSSWYHEDRINETGECNATLAPPANPDLARQTLAATIPARSTIVAVRTDDRGVSRAEYTLWVPPGARRLPHLTGGNLLSFFDRQTIPNTLTWASVEQVLIIALLVDVGDYTITQTGTGLQFTPGPKINLSGLVASNVFRSQTYNFWEGKNVGEAIRDIASRINGVDFDIRTEFGAGPNGTLLPVRRLRTWYPRRGRTVGGGGPVFTLGKNLINEPEIPGNRDFITTTIGLGDETDEVTRERLQEQWYNFTLLGQGWPLVSRVIDRPDVTTTQGLEDLARGDLLRNNSADADEIVLEVDPNDDLYPWGSWDLGDDCRMVYDPGVSPWWPDGFNAERRIIAHRWTVNDQGEHLRVVTGKPWSADT